jgi:anti-anti-sigma factor
VQNLIANPLAVAVVAPLGEVVARVCLAGDVDITGEDALAAADQLDTITPRTVIVDLAAVTFACSTLATFLVRVHNILPDGAVLILYRPTPRTRHLLDLTGLDAICTVREDLPPQGSDVRPRPGGAGP